MSSALRPVLLLVVASLLVVVGAIGLVTDVRIETNPAFPDPVNCGTALSRIDHGTGGLGMLCDGAIAARRGWVFITLLLALTVGAVALSSRSRSTEPISASTTSHTGM